MASKERSKSVKTQPLQPHPVLMMRWRDMVWRERGKSARMQLLLPHPVFNDAVPRYGIERAQQICQKGATSATSQCFNENVARFGIERARQICAPTPNNPLAIQECIKSLIFDPQGNRTQISESAAAIACQRSVR
ncbi:MAG: hypothetical protein HC935_02960 [Pseudanabaena sp. SU_2_4]|nr:hypothetical protein [Pseudanabaena sp. SU_2_4]